MEIKYFIKSKLNVVPEKKSQILTIAVNVALVLVFVSGVIKMIAEGFQFGTAGYMCIAYLIVSGFKNRPENREHYEASIVEASISESKIRLCYNQIKQYKGKGYIVEVAIPSIQVLEYSDQLTCLHVAGTIRKGVEGSKKTDLCTDHYLYLELGSEREILSLIEQQSGVKIVYMDR